MCATSHLHNLSSKACVQLDHMYYFKALHAEISHLHKLNATRQLQACSLHKFTLALSFSYFVGLSGLWN